MKSKKCSKCGLVCSAEALACKQCGNAFSDFEEGSGSTRSKSGGVTLSRLALVAPLLGLMFSGLRPYIGWPAFPFSVLLLLAGLALGIVALVRINRGRDEGPKWQAIAGVAGSSCFLGLALILSFLIISLPRRVQKPVWREYFSAKGRYKIQLPGTAVESSKQLSSKIIMDIAEVNLKEDGACASFYYDYSNYTITASQDEFLSGLTNQAIANSEGTEVYRKPITLGGNQGFEYEVTLKRDKDGQDVVSTARIIWVQDRTELYMQIVTTPIRGELYQQRFKYLDSFQLLSNRDLEEKFRAMQGPIPPSRPFPSPSPRQMEKTADATQ